jgi:hypothetical protein
MLRYFNKWEKQLTIDMPYQQEQQKKAEEKKTEAGEGKKLLGEVVNRAFQASCVLSAVGVYEIIKQTFMTSVLPRDLVINFIHIPKNGGTTINCMDSPHVRYHDHSTDVFASPYIPNQCVVLRHPVERFQSAVRYVLQEPKFAADPGILTLLRHNINTADKWVDAWRDEAHPHHERVLRTMRNTHEKILFYQHRHWIGQKVLEFNYVFTPQTAWFNNPRFVVLMENYDTEMQYLLRRATIPRKNVTTRTTATLSPGNVAWLQGFYREDLELYRWWQRVPASIRLGAAWRSGDAS